MIDPHELSTVIDAFVTRSFAPLKTKLDDGDSYLKAASVYADRAEQHLELLEASYAEEPC
jgi:hypothetical protein